ncbi:TPA: leucyl aminopeptidase [Candidatus Dependentiae bacterium]|nr:MAG: putative cytosol aminopeptidase [candidate division TM6 bacterium GW2011_GWF2_36_131]KKQ03221.1 MAG: putative cytosol aminopeptidase [candidate division TM6 bacterium GW2011_GWE2_36_25]KKQ18191.1 MAG: putative cytosol aminopeptidase [candidate division TM6 bacterium GW2011_GWA2_36_9]HBR70349.1 leucyl aminopeptidase [Candidatus Dependentiae bacterium]HCU00894.1 leucyl aminopeptidase [Candidatus Dependentiae bacterium]
MAINFSLSGKQFLQDGADVYALFVEQDFDFKKLSSELLALFPHLETYCKEQDFSGKEQSNLSIPVMHEQKLVYILLAGLGKKEKKVDIENYRRALARIVRFMQRVKVNNLALHLPLANLFGVTDQVLGQETATIAHMTDYIFDTFKEQEGGEKDIEIILVLQKHNRAALQKGIKNGEIIGNSINDAREWVNLPANVLRPDELASQAKQIAKEHDLGCTIFNEKKINELGMGGLAAVSSGSEQECRFVILEYKTDKKNAQTIGFVGKGITYDSGGLSIKPSKSMETMKEDMAGGAAVIAAMKALAQFKPAVNIIAIIPLAENLPSGVAAKPGDIVRMYNGKTVEIKNTDAEGRLILGDALAYMAKNYKPVMMFDLATLTGACQHALGPFFSGLFGVDESIIKKVEKAAQIAGEPVWRLPLTKDYEKAMDCPVADLCNIANPKFMAGATTAAVFLKNFVNDIPWAHLDIAGTSFNVPDIPYQRAEMATGVGVRLLIELALQWAK